MAIVYCTHNKINGKKENAKELEIKQEPEPQPTPQPSAKVVEMPKQNTAQQPTQKAANGAKVVEQEPKEKGKKSVWTYIGWGAAALATGACIYLGLPIITGGKKR